MPSRYTLDTFTNTITNRLDNFWQTAKNYLTVENSIRENRTHYHSVNYKKIIVMGAMSLLASKDQWGLGIGLATTALLAEPVGAALPFVANPIPTQYAQPGQAWSIDIDLNQVFNDADGDVMTFGGVTMADGTLVPSWLTAAPIKLSGRDYANEAYAVEVVGDLAYVADDSSGLQLINVNNASNLTLLGSYDTLGQAYSVTVQNGVACVADDTSGLQLINVSNASAPSFLGVYNTPGNAYDIAVQNGVAYMADGAFGLQLINMSNASVLHLLGSYDTPGNAYGVALQNEVAYVADGTSGLQIIGLKFTRLSAIIPFNGTGNYSLRVHATNVNGEWISTEMLLRITNMTQPSATLASSPTVVPTMTTVPSNPSTGVASSSSITSNTDSLSTGTSTSATQSSAAMTFSIMTPSTSLSIEAGLGALLTTEYLSVLGNVNPDQVIYTVLGNNPDIVITVNGLVATQFTQADVEGQFVEIALNGVTCGEYSTDLQLEANVAGSSASPQRVDVGLIFQGTTCTDAGRLSAFSFRDANIGFWAQKREVEARQLKQTIGHVPTFRR